MMIALMGTITDLVSNAITIISAALLVYIGIGLMLVRNDNEEGGIKRVDHDH